MNYKPFHINSEFVNRTSTDWPGDFTDRTVPYSSLSGLIPGSNVLAAAASTLRGGSANKSKKNIRVYNRMAKSKRRGSMSKRRMSKRRGQSRRMRKGMSKGMRKGMRMKGGNSWTKGDWITGNALNYTTYSTPFNLPPTLSALANPVPFLNNSRIL